MFVGNLHSETMRDSIRPFLRTVAAVRKLKLKVDGKTGLSRGFGFIEKAEAEADIAIAKSQGKLLDRQIIHIHVGHQKVHGLASPERLIPNAAAARDP